MEIDRENPSPLVPLPGELDAGSWQNWQLDVDLETAYLRQLAGVDRLEDATSLHLVVNTAAGGSIAHLGATLPSLNELNLNGSTLESLRDLGTGFRLLQVLWVSRCGITALDGLGSLPALRELYAAYNDISDLQQVDSCQHLEVLDMESNCIPDTDSVLYLAACTSLQTLTLAGNPAAEQPGYRSAVCAALTSLRSLDDEPVTPEDRGEEPERESSDATVTGAAGSATRRSAAASSALLAPSPLRAAATAAAAAATAAALDAVTEDSAQQQGSRPAGPPDPAELALVVAGIKHARVGLDSHEFHEIEMNLLVATADGTDVNATFDSRPGTGTGSSALLPASAGTWVRTLRSSREGSLAALRASAQAAAQATSLSPSPSSASPASSRPPSSQQHNQQQASCAHGMAPASAPERWAIPAGSGWTTGTGLSFSGTGPSSTGTKRPGSGAGANGGHWAGIPGSPARPGSGDHRPMTGSASRPFTSRPGTAASVSARLGTSASVGAAPAASAGLYWAKNRLSGRDGASGSSGTDAAGGAASGADGDSAVVSSRLTQGSDTPFGGSLARDLRKWKGAAVRASIVEMGPDSATGQAAAAHNGLNNGGLSLTLLRGGQLDPKALLEELKRWKLETADKVLAVDPDEVAGAGSGEWSADDGPAAGAWGLGAGASPARRADVLLLSSSHDPELGVPSLLDAGPEPAASPAVPSSPLQPARPPGGRRKMVLSKVVRDVASDSVGSSGASISETLALRPLQAPPPWHSAHPAGGARPGTTSSGSAHGAEAAGAERGSSSSAPTAAGATHHHSPHSHPYPAQQHQPNLGTQPSAYHRQSSARSGCSSSGFSDHGNPSRPESREEGTAGSSSGCGAMGVGGGLQQPASAQRQRSGSRAPGLPPGPSAPAHGAYRVASLAGEVDVRRANPQPIARPDEEG